MSSENNATSEFSSLTLFSWNTVLPLNLRSLSPSGNSLPLAVLSCLHPNQLKGVAPSAIQAAQQRLQTALQDWLPRKNINWPNFTSAYAHADICLKPEGFSSRQATCWTTWNIAVDESANKHKKSIRLGNIHRIQHIGQVKQKTRWNPRTRMLTRMFMVQMSKHMVMQSRTIPFCNSLFEQSCACFPCYQSAVWSGQCSVECGVWSVK